MTDYAFARRNMVESQLRPNRVSDDVLLEAMETVPRELFVPANRRGIAYVDEDIEVDRGRFLVEPMVLARMVQAAELDPSDLVLDVGCASGYSTAILARLCGTVVGLECDAALAETAGTVLTDLGIDNAVVIAGDLTAGYAKQAPYNAIILQGAVAEIPSTLAAQLAEGGRLLAVRRTGRGLGQAVRVIRTGETYSTWPLFDAGTPYLPGFEPVEAFAF